MLVPQEKPLNRQVLRENTSLKTGLSDKLIPTIKYKQHDSSNLGLLRYE
jgi:hypothetical protein